MPEPASAYADSSTMLVIPRSFFNYVGVALAAFALGALVTYLGMTALFNPNSQENQALISNAVGTVQANIVAANPTEDPGLVQGTVYENVSVDDDPAIGAENPTVTMIEFSDFRCPYCKRYVQETFPLLQAAYGDRVQFVFRDLPILGSASQQAAIAGYCADEQGRFWEFHDWAYSHQQEFSREAFIAWAETEGLNLETFNTCLDTQAEGPEFVADYQAVASLTSRLGTPMFFVDGEFISGAQPYNVFADAIERALARAGDSESTPESSTSTG
jgi:protein-disulfide isomerase